MSAEVIYGNNLCLFYDVTEGSVTTKKCTAVSTSCKLSINRSSRKTSSKDSGNWEESKPNKMSWTASTDALFTTDEDSYNYDFLFEQMVSGKQLTITFGVTTGTVPQVLKAGKTYKGTVNIAKLDLNAPNEDNASFSVEFEGTGKLETVTVA